VGLKLIFQPDRVLLRKFITDNVPSGDYRVIDVGGGSGKRYQDLFKSYDYISVDSDSKTNPTIVCSAEDIPVASNSFEVVLCAQMLEHVKYPQNCLKEMFRILKNDGICIITVPFFNETHMEPVDFWRFTLFGIRVLCEDAGFTILKANQRGGYYSTKAQMSIRKSIEKYNLYDNPVLAKIYRPWSKMLTYSAIKFDSVFQSRVNNKFCLGYGLVLTKLPL
jgi:ubiquinone/menaquinone biosynthesis C-methylase UbiE